MGKLKADPNGPFHDPKLQEAYEKFAPLAERSLKKLQEFGEDVLLLEKRLTDLGITKGARYNFTDHESDPPPFLQWKDRRIYWCDEKPLIECSLEIRTKAMKHLLPFFREIISFWGV